MTELLVGTKKGLFALQGDDGAFEITARAFAGEPVEFAMRDPRSGRYLACVTSAFYGPKIFVTDDPAGEWQQAEGVELPEDQEKPLERLWAIVPGEEDGLLYAGGDPGVLFESRDGGTDAGSSTRPSGSSRRGPTGAPAPAACACTRSRPGPATRRGSRWGSRRSASGCPTTAARPGGTGTKASSPRYLPEESRENTIALCVHNMHRHPTKPERLFMQFHGGVYRSDDAGESWIDIGTDTGLPSDFGFPLVIDPDDADSAYVIPLVADLDRVTPEGRVRVYETRDAGASWTARGDGLPAENAYLTILRQAFGARRLGREHGPVLRRDLGRRLRLARRGRDVVHGGVEAPAGALGARRVGRGAGHDRVRPRSVGRRACPARGATARPGRGSRIRSASIRDAHAPLAGLARGVDSLPVYFFDSRSICASAPSSTSARRPVDASTSGTGRPDRRPRARVSGRARGSAASRDRARC